MDEVLLLGILKKASLIMGVIGALAGLDLVCGGWIMSLAKKSLEKSIDFDKVIIKITSNLRDALDKKAWDVDRVIANVRMRVALGVLFLFLSATIILLTVKT